MNNAPGAVGARRTKGDGMPNDSTRGLQLFVADDHMVVRQGLIAILKQEGFQVIGEASDGHTAVSMCSALKPDVAIVDLAMPVLNGIDAAREVIKLSPKTRVVLLTMYTQQNCVLAGLRAGVTGYVLKSSAASSLVQAVEAVSRGETYLSQGVSRAVVQAYLSNLPFAADPLSGREREVLQLIAEGRNMKEIGGVLGVSARTAETHRTRIMAKLNIHDIAGLVRYAIEQNLIGIGPQLN